MGNPEVTVTADTVAYLRSIRSPAKKAYAKAYATFLEVGGTEPERGTLSYMGAQAVRMHLSDLEVAK